MIETIKQLPFSSISPDGMSRTRGFWHPHGLAGQAYGMVGSVYADDCYRAYSLIPGRTPTTLLDLGAGIGCFARLWRERFPTSKIVCVEANPKLIPSLRRNVGKFAEVVESVVGWWSGDAYMLDAVGYSSIGGTRILEKKQFDENDEVGYAKVLEPVNQIRLIELIPKDACSLKVGIEGSEYMALRGGLPEQVKVVMLEAHNNAKWKEFMPSVFAESEWASKEIWTMDDGDGMSRWHFIRRE